jgi:hypothetical protein
MKELRIQDRVPRVECTIASLYTLQQRLGKEARTVVKASPHEPDFLLTLGMEPGG